MTPRKAPVSVRALVLPCQSPPPGFQLKADESRQKRGGAMLTPTAAQLTGENAEGKGRQNESHAQPWRFPADAPPPSTASRCPHAEG